MKAFNLASFVFREEVKSAQYVPIPQEQRLLIPRVLTLTTAENPQSIYSYQKQAKRKSFQYRGAAVLNDLLHY